MRSLISSKTWIFLVCLSGFISVMSVQAETKVLVLGSSQPYNAGEAAFPPSGIASNLASILSGDSGVSQPVTVKSVDTYQTNVVDAWASHTLMSWYYYPYTQTNREALLGEGWNYVVMIDDPHVASKFPEYHFEGVKAISDDVRKAGSIPVSVMTWSSGSTALATFGEMAYRVGDGASVAVAPAGYAWNDVKTALKGSGTRPNANGVYVTAATVYSRIYNRNAKVSTYIPSGLSQADRDSLADTALTSVQTEAARSHYSGVLVRPTHFASPLNTKSYLEYTDFNSSSEWRIRPGITDSMANAFVGGNCILSGYQSFPTLGRQIDFCQMRDYAYGYDPAKWKNYGTFDYHDHYGALTMMSGIERVMYHYNNGPAQEQETGAADVTAAYISGGEFYVPSRVLFSRIRTAYPTFFVYDSYNHLSAEVSYAMGSAMFSLLTGRCPIADAEPVDKTSSAWQKWYAIKVGYELAWQHATLNSRVPGFQVKPRAVNATNLTVGAIEPLTVRFRYAPTSTVTVAVSLDNTDAAIINPTVLTFTPNNYDVTQTVSICGTPGLLANEAVNVNLVTSSSDGVFNGLTDQWAYNTKRSVTTNVTVSLSVQRNVTVTEDTPKVIDLGVTGATSGNTVVVGPVHGTWTPATFTYSPATNYYGSDRIAFYVNLNGTLTVNSVSIVVTNVPDSVLLTSPTNNATYSVIETVPMSVNGYWAGGRVDYFANGILVGSESDEPWTMTWSNMATGSYSIKAVAYGSSGAAVTSAVANVTIAASSGMWWTNNSGLWASNSNWRGNYIPNAVPALFNGVDITGTVTVQVDGERTPSHLVFGDSVLEETQWILGSSQWGSADLDLRTPPACWVVSDGGNNLNSLRLMGSPAVIEVQALGDRPPAIRPNEYAAVMALKLTVTNGLVKDGPGTLVLAATNDISGGVTIQSALGGVMTGVNGALGNSPVTMYENTWLASVDGSNSNGLITVTNAIQLAGSTNANYRIGPGMASDLTISGKIDGRTIGSGSTLMLGGRGRGIWAAGTGVPAQRTANTIVGATTLTLSGDIDIGTRTLALLGCWPCSGNLTNRITAGQITAGNLMYDYAGNGQSLTSIGGSSVVNLSGALSCATNGPLIIRDQAQVAVVGQLTGNTISITNQAQLTAGGLSYVNLATSSTVYFHGGTTDVKSIRMAVASFNGGVIRAGCSTNNFLEGPATLLDGNYTVAAGGLKFDTDGYDVEISHSLKHGAAAPVDGGLQKLGLGRLTLSASNTFNGPVSVAAGTLAVNGTLGTNSSVTVASGATLSGTGTIARAVVIQSGGTLAPGNSGGDSALTIQGSLALQAGSGFNASWGSQAIVNGNVSLSNSVLSITGTGDGTFLLIDNRGSNPVAGTFTGLPESALVTVGGVSRWLTYCGGDGNDVALRSVQVTNLAASAITRTSATLQGRLQYVGGAYDVSVYWGTTDGGTNAAVWEHTNVIGSYTNVTMTNVTFNTGSVLSQGATYYYTFRATNATASVWAQPSASLMTIDTPAVGNAGGAVNPTESSATLQGLLTAGGGADAWICWGDNDSGTSSTSTWDKVQFVGPVSQNSVFAAPVTGLATSKTYFYRCFVTNAAGQAWSASASIFNASSVVGNGDTNSGGIVTNYTLNGVNYTAHIFTNSGTFNVQSAGNVEVLVVGGGGGGASRHGGGGGAGGLLYTNAYPVFAGSNYTVTVGGGGAGNPNGGAVAAGSPGTNSVFGNGVSALVAYGGGYGGATIGGPGGSGGGGGYNGNAGGLGTTGQGWKGGTGAGNYAGRGGGGASGQGVDGGGVDGSNGGPGTNLVMSGTATWYAGGGGGGSATGVKGTGGSGIGGDGGQPGSIMGGAGAVNTGSGGGGGGGSLAGSGGGNGGSGIVIVRYVSEVIQPIQNLAPTGIMSSRVSLNAILVAPATNYAVTVFWGTTDCGTNAGTWAHSASVGSWTNIVSTNITVQASGLAASTTYYYAFRAVNAGTNVWAQPSWQFATRPAPTVPAVANQSSSPSDDNSAMLSGLLTGGAEADAWICWGDNDGGIISTSAWDHVLAVGAVEQDVDFTAQVTGLSTNKTYFYRCFVTNAAGLAWSASATSFNGTPAGGSGGSGVTGSGGTVINYTLNGTNFTAHIFTNNGTLVVTSDGHIEVLVVAGGGGGGGSSGPYGSGGGAGGLIYSSAYPVVAGSNYTITVGGGGAGNSSGVGANGTNSVFGSLIALGGGGGSSQSTPGSNGGSGGGGYNGGTAGTALQPGSASGGYGHNGSVGGNVGFAHGGGGGGAGETLPNDNGDGGYGLAFSVSGSTVYYAGGGNGNASTTVVPGGGGIIKASGAVNTGGGGGGASGGNPGSGGSGIVIVRYVSGGSSAIQNMAPTSIANNTASLNAALSAASTNYAVTVFWGTTDGGTTVGAWTSSATVGSWTNVASTNIAVKASGLAASTTYYYAFRATNASTTAWAQPSWSFRTLEQIGIPVPSSLTATPSSGQIKLAWTDNSTNETGFAIERSVTSGSGFATIGTAGANATNYTDNTVSAATTYYYRVSATNSTESSTPSAEAFATTPKLPATVTLSNLSQAYDGTARFVTTATSPTGLAVTVTYNGVAIAPTNAGSYAVTGTVASATYQGWTNATLSVAKATPTVSLWPTATVITVGQALSNATLTGGSASVSGSFSYNSPTNIPPVGIYTAAVTFAVSDSINYANVSGTVNVTVAAIPTYTVSYDGNGKTSGSAPGNQTKTNNVSLTLATNSGSLVRTGYTFAGWNTLTNGTGSDYAAGATYNANAAVTLYAKWTPNIYTISYNGNGNTSGTAPGSQIKTNDVNLTLATNSGGLARTGHIFVGWNTTTNGTGTDYAVGATYTANATATLYAKWTSLLSPTNLTAMALSSTQIKLAWADTSADETGFLVERSNTNGTGFASIGTAVVNATNYTDTTVGPGSNYYYRVSATNALMSSAPSSEAFAATPKLPATVTFSNISQTYDGTARAVSYTTSPTGLAVTVTYNGVVLAPTNAGSYAVTGTVVSATYMGTTNGTLTVTAKNVSTLTLTSVGPFTYNGAAQTPAPQVSDGATVLTTNVHYTLSYLANTNAGSATVTVTGTGNYTGTTNSTFTINPATLTVTPNAGQTKVFGGSDPVFAYANSGAVGGETADFGGTLARVAGESVGSYAITQGTLELANNGAFKAANYTLSFTAGVNFSITSKSASALTIADIAPLMYDNTAKTPEPEVRDGAMLLVKNTDYTLSYANNTSAGTATVTVTGTSNYTGTQNKNFTITRATPTVEPWPTATSITLGQPLSASTLSGGTPSVPGSFAFVSPTNIPLAGITAAALEFAPTDSANYQSITGAVAVTVIDLNAIPFSEPFEARDLGPLNGQNGWVAGGTEVQGTNTFGGSTKAAHVSGSDGYLKHGLTAGKTKVWTDLRIQVVQSQSQLMPDATDATVVVYVSTNNMVMAYDGTSVVETGLTAQQGQWIRMTVCSDYVAKNYLLYVNDIKAGPYNFYNSGLSSYTELKVKGTATFIDNIGITEIAPPPFNLKWGTVIMFMVQ